MVSFNQPGNLSQKSIHQIKNLDKRVCEDIMKTSVDVDETESGKVPRITIGMIVAGASLAASIKMLSSVLLLRPIEPELAAKLATMVLDELEKIYKDENNG